MNERHDKKERSLLRYFEPANSVSVVMMSNSAGMTNSSIRQFMKYISSAHDVNSMLLKYDILKDAPVRQGIPECKCNCNCCNCILLSTVKEIKMPQELTELTESRWLTELTESRWLLPSMNCLKNSCHGCTPDLVLHDGESHFAVFDALDFEFTTPTQKEPICICIPVPDPESGDKWTKLLVRSFKDKDKEDKGAIVAASDALQSYLDKRTEDRAELVIYRKVSLIVIRFVEIFINLLLTGFFKVDGFSSSLAARRAVRSYVVDSKGNGLPANAFLTSALVVVKSDSVCQVLKFRSNILGGRTLLFIVGCFNLICSIAWSVVLIAFNGGVGKWYEIPSMPPSKPRVAVIIAFIGIGISMDCSEIFKLVMKGSDEMTKKKKFMLEFFEIFKHVMKGSAEKKNICRLLAMIVFEILFAAVVGALATVCSSCIERWVYGALQVLVWVKWGLGSYMLGAFSPEYVPTPAKLGTDKDDRTTVEYSSEKWQYEGSLVYSSSFFLNAVLVGVMGNWAGVWSSWK